MPYSWLIKYPMKSQQMGRRTRRFFVLRDNYLSYHKDRPTVEEDPEEHDSQNTLVLTANSTVEVGRKFLTRCLIVSTPADTLWIRVRGDYAQEAVKWLTELNKSLQFLQRRKLRTVHVSCQ